MGAAAATFRGVRVKRYQRRPNSRPELTWPVVLPHTSGPTRSLTGSGEPLTHRVAVEHTPERTRATCACSWRSPWVTAGPPQPDVPPRTDYVDKAVRAGEWHIRTAAGR